MSTPKIKTPAYFRSRIKLLPQLITKQTEDKNELQAAQMRGGFLPESHREWWEGLMVADAASFGEEPLTDQELCTFDTFFDLHPEKIAGIQVPGTSYVFPITVKGTKEDVMAMFSFLDVVQPSEEVELEETKEVILKEEIPVVEEVHNYVPQAEPEKAFSISSFKDAISIIPTNQLRVVNQNLRGEEKEYFQNLIKEIDRLAKDISDKRPEADSIMEYPVYFHYFYAGSDWLISEYYPKEGLFYGYVVLNGDTEMSEFGSIGIDDIAKSNRVEMDFHWKQKSIGEALHERYPDDFVNPSKKVIQPVSVEEDIKEMKETLSSLFDQMASKVDQNLPISHPSIFQAPEVPAIVISPETLESLEKALEPTEKPSNSKLTLSIQEVIEKFNNHISEAEIKAWVWYKRSFGNPMKGFEKYFVSNNKTGKTDILCYAKSDTQLLDNRWQLIRVVQKGTLIGRKTRFRNEYQGIDFVVVKSENQELLWVDESELKEVDQTFYTDPDVLEKLAMQKALIYCNGEYLPIPVYQFGDMYEREKQLEEDKLHIVEHLGQLYYDLYKQLIEDGKPKMLRFEDVQKSMRPRISILSLFANDITLMSVMELDEATGIKLERAKKRGQYNEDTTPFTLREGFERWLTTVRDTDIKNTTKFNIGHYYLDNGRFPSGTTEVEKEEVRNNAKIACEDLFADFMATALLPNDSFKLNVLWNKTYNQFGNVRSERVPIAFECSSTFKNAPLNIKKVQRDGVSFLSLINAGCLAYDVGYGKTLTACIDIATSLSIGTSKRILVAVPRPTYKNWRKELFGFWTDGTNVAFDSFPKAQFVTGLLSHTKYKLNDWYNLDTKRLASLGDINKPVEENTITLVTYQGLAKIGFSKSVSESILFSSLCDILEDGSIGTTRANEKRYEKYREMIGEGNKSTVCDIDVCGFDKLTVDEAHNFNKVFDKVGKNEDNRNLFGISSNPSTRAIKLFFLTNYIQRKFNGGVTLLTATPFTNSPLEIYSMLSFIGFESLRKYNLQNIRRFFETFILESIEYVVDLKGNISTKPVIKSFNNKYILQKLLYNHFDYRNDPKEAGIVRPCKVNLPMTKGWKEGELVPLPPDQVITTYLDMTEEQMDIQMHVRELANSAGYGQNAGNMFRAMAKSLDNALSPFLASGTIPLDHMDLVEKSPKIKFVMECIRSVKEYHEARGENVSGQVIYSDRGKELFDYIKEYLHEEIGYERVVYFGDVKLSEVEIMEGGGSASDEERKEDVKEAFLKGIVKVIIGTSTIKEGVNLQNKGTVLYNMYLNWNPTDLKQLEGRIHRQGNEFGYVRIVMPLVQNSMDAFVFQKLEEKQSRISDIWGRGGSNVMEDEGIDPEEIKYALITDAEQLMKMSLEKEAKQAESLVSVAEANLETYGNLKKYIHEFLTKKESIVSKMKINVAWYKTKLAEMQSSSYQSDIKKKIIEKLENIIPVIEGYLFSPIQDERQVFEIFRLTTFLQKNYYEYAQSEHSNYFTYGGEWMRDTYRAAYSNVKKAEKDVLAAHGLTIYDDLSDIKQELDLALSEALSYKHSVTGSEHIAQVMEKVQMELDKRASIRGDLYQQVEKFKTTNNLLSYKADNTDRENCDLPIVECCPTNGREEIIIESDEPMETKRTITVQDYRDTLEGLEILLEDMVEGTKEYSDYFDTIEGLRLMIEMEEEQLQVA